MGIRMSGLMSGLDTEAIVGALMSAQSLKKTKVERSKTKLEWTQTKWADLNTKLKKLYNEQVTKMQLQSSYKAKKATVSDPSKVNVKAGTSAVNGSYSLEVKNIATTQYLTGAKINASSGTDKLVDVDPSLLNKEVTVTNGDKTVKFEIGADMTINDFTKQLRNAGLNASYDTTQKRFFISSKDSGLKNAFSITTTAVSDDEVAGRQALRDAVGYNSMTADNKKIIDSAMETLKTSGVGTDEYNTALDNIAKAVHDTKSKASTQAATTYVKAKLYAENYDSYKTQAEDTLKSNYYNEDGTVKEELAEKYGNEYDILTQEDKDKLSAEKGISSKEDYIAAGVQKDYDDAVAKKADSDTTSYVNTQISSDDAVKAQIKTAAFDGVDETTIGQLDEIALQKYYKTAGSETPVINSFEGTKSFTDEEESIKNSISAAVSGYAGITDRNSSLSQSALTGLGLADITMSADGKVLVNGGANDKSNTSIPEGMALIAASDSEVILNGAKLTSSTSTVSANGLDLELVGLTKEDEPITFSVTTDVDGVYNSVKNFLKEYNAIMKEMNELYNADSAKGYEPLTSEQKEAMTDEDVKLWEDKIKNSLLRRDSTLNGIIQGMRSAMTSQVQYNGKSYSLASFGIMTSTDYTEGGLFHIYGDTDDATYADKDDKLKKALEQDPDAVVNVLSSVFTNLRKTMMDKMAGSKTSSALTFYEDIKMKDDLKAYEKDIKAWETKLASMEDAYYKKFTAMEKAMAKLQSQQSNLSALFGN
ncbi:MAG: flagellar filament capping protein FliD [Roseburia sp.]|nr:flagellar filament capping protein FliD [Roseburia sp.]